MSERMPRVINNGIVLIQHEKIEKVLDGDRESFVSNGYRIVDAGGGFVLPGFIEAHCHMGITEEKKGMEGDDCNETVNPITPSLRALDAINPMDDAFHRAIEAGITSAMIGPGSSNVIGGQFAFLNLHGRCLDDMVLKTPAAMKVAFGENPKVNYSGMSQSPSTRMAIANMLRQKLFEAQNYLEQKDAAPDWELECFRPVFEKKIPLKAHVHRADDILTAIRIAREFDVELTLDHCTEGHLIAEKIKESGFPAIVGPDLSSRNKIEVKNMDFKTAGILAKEGIETAVTTDHPVSVIWSLPICAALCVKAGMEMEAGLKAITISAAKICRMDHLVGSLEAGKLANITIFNGHPFDIFSKNLCTFICGEIVYKDSGFFI